jgi:hypothetical protein
MTFELPLVHLLSVVELTYNDIILRDASPIAPDILWYQLIPHC